jgi:hypothetical protein
MPRRKKDLTEPAAPAPWTYLEFDISWAGRQLNVVPITP